MNIAKTRKTVGAAVRYTVLSVGSLVMLYPLIFMVLAGFFTKEEYWHTTLGLFPIPKQPTLNNYLALFDPTRVDEIARPALNTVSITLATVLVTVVTVLFSAYAFTRLKWRGQNAAFFTLLATAMLPSTMSLIPRYILYAKLHLLDTMSVYFVGLPAINVMGTFITMQYLRSIPMALDESARMDGANVWQIMWRILLPAAKPIFGYIIITTAIGAWNNWQTGFFFTDSAQLRTLPAVLAQLAISGTGVPDYPYMITLGLLITIPAMIIYLIFQRYIVEGLVSAGIKG